MTRKTSSVKSAKRQEQGRAAIAGLPRDPKTGRLMKRQTPAPASANSSGASTAAPASQAPGGEPAGAPFDRGRGIRRWRPRTSA